jgi:hypothetical protein
VPVRLASALLLIALALAGCGGDGSSGGDARGVLRDTAAKLGEIRSGDLTLRVVANSDGSEAGYELTGPFAFAESADALPVAELEYTQIAGSESETVTFISTGERAYVASGDATFELPEDETAALRGSGAGGSDSGSSNGLEELDIGAWFVEPELSDGGEVGGAETDRIEAQLDAVVAANDILEVVGAFGGGEVTVIEGASAEQLRRAIESATIEVYTGKDDRLLRRLVLDARFRAAPPPELAEAFATLPEAEFHIELTIADPNRDVTVEEPTNAQPFPE